MLPGGIGGLLIALFFQIPNLVIQSNQQPDLAGWLGRQQELLRVMDFFPWGWASRALAGSAAGNQWSALGWSLLLPALGGLILAAAFLLVERGFRRGWISLSRDEGRRVKGRRIGRESTTAGGLVQGWNNAAPALSPAGAAKGSPRRGMWAVAKKDLLYLESRGR